LSGNANPGGSSEETKRPLMRSQMLAKSPKTAHANLLFAAVLHDPALEIVLTKHRMDLARG
jgi:hypothetical protein